jgi:radical SAM superfamily enzyme YgiQ (UPF0313 family)
MPIGVAYMKAVMDRDLPAGDVESRVFAYPDALLTAMKENPPDVLMVSNYVWNEALSLFFLELGKRLNPKMLAVMGGPNLSVEPERQIAFVQANPQIDIYVVGEGDVLARDIVRSYHESGKRLDRCLAMDHESSVVRRPDGTIERTEPWDRARDVEVIPSPWLTGIMDEFFDGRLAPMIETNRGCPFACSFCVQGTKFYNKIANFSLERLETEIEYIATMIKRKSPSVGMLRIADANYGMYDRDVTISGYIGRVQRKYGWPTFIDATTGKNRAEKIIESMEQVNGAIVLYQAAQSLDEEVLRNVRRTNIKLDAYSQIAAHVRGRGLRMNSDLILGLPGETLQSHTDGMRKLISAATDQMHCFQAMMLKGADMESLESRESFKFKTAFRVLPKNYGAYDGVRVFDIEEIVVATETLPFEDYIGARELHMTFSVFWNDGWFRDVVDFAQRCGIDRFDWLMAMLDALRCDDGRMRAFLDQFVAETKGELFPTREACAEFYGRDENFDRLRRSEIGDNLMYKYRAIASFELWPEVCDLAMTATRGLLVDRGIAADVADFDDFWSDLHRFIFCKHAHGASVKDVLAPVTATLRYDIPRWLSEGTPRDTKPYRLPPTEWVFRLSDAGAKELDAAFEVWSTELKGLSKLVTRIRIDSQVRDCEPAEDVTSAARSNVA